MIWRACGSATQHLASKTRMSARRLVLVLVRGQCLLTRSPATIFASLCGRFLCLRPSAQVKRWESLWRIDVTES